MTTLLRVYNEALRHLGERRLASTSEARDARYHLDDAVTEVKAKCLEAGYWNFAMRAIEQTASGTLTPAFGFSYAFEKPSDWVRTYIVSPNEWLGEWVSRFNDEAGIWYAQINPIWAKYVSNDTSYGYDLSLWPQSFAGYVAAELALAVAPSISSTSADKLADLKETVKRTKSSALAKDAMNEPPVAPPHGSWVRSRGGSWTGSGSTAVPGGRIF